MRNYQTAVEALDLSDICVSPRKMVRWRSAPSAPPLYCYAIIVWILVVLWHRRWCRIRVTFFPEVSSGTPEEIPEKATAFSSFLTVELREKFLETNLASRWEGVRLPRASGKSPDFSGSSPNFPGSFSATSPEVLSLWKFTAIQGFPGSFPDFPGSSPDFPGSLPDFPGGQPFLWEAWHPLLTHKNFLWKTLRTESANFRAFRKGVFARGGNSIIRVVRAPVAINNFASNPCENLWF